MYLGTAVVVGIIMGSIMHLTSTVLMSALHIGPDEDGDEARPARSSAAVKRLEGRDRRLNAARPKMDEPRLRRYRDRHDQSRVQQKGGLLSQIILEEEDDSEEAS